MYKGISLNGPSEKVAIKEVCIKNFSSEQLTNIRLEMNILSQLKHKSIVKLFSVYSVPDRIYLVIYYKYL